MTPKSKKKQKSHDFPKVDVWFFFLFVCFSCLFRTPSVLSSLEIMSSGWTTVAGFLKANRDFEEIGDNKVLTRPSSSFLIFFIGGQGGISPAGSLEGHVDFSFSFYFLFLSFFSLFN